MSHPRTQENTPLALNPHPSEQEVFDAVVQHAAQMPQQCAVAFGGCLYRGPNGNACFVGALLTDEEANGLDSLNDNVSVTGLVDLGLLPQRLIPHQSLLAELQEIHDDDQNMAEWPRALTRLASIRHLDDTGIAPAFAVAAHTPGPANS